MKVKDKNELEGENGDYLESVIVIDEDALVQEEGQIQYGEDGKGEKLDEDQLFADDDYFPRVKYLLQSFYIAVFIPLIICFWYNSNLFPEATRPESRYFKDFYWDLNKIVKIITFTSFLVSFLHYRPRGSLKSQSMGCFFMTTAFSALLLEPIGVYISRLRKIKITKKQQKSNIFMVVGFISIVFARSVVSYIDRIYRCFYDVCMRCLGGMTLKKKHIGILCFVRKTIQHNMVWIYLAILACYMVRVSKSSSSSTTMDSHDSERKNKRDKLREWKARIRRNELLFLCILFFLVIISVAESSFLEKNELHNGFHSFVFLLWRNVDLCLYEWGKYVLLDLLLLFLSVRVQKAIPNHWDEKCRIGTCLLKNAINIFVRLNQGVIAYLVVMNIHRTLIVMISFAIYDECSKMKEYLRRSSRFLKHARGEGGQMEEDIVDVYCKKKRIYYPLNDFIRSCENHFFLEENGSERVKIDYEKLFSGRDDDGKNKKKKWEELSDQDRSRIMAVYRYEPFEEVTSKMHYLGNKLYFLILCIIIDRAVGLMNVFWHLLNSGFSLNDEMMMQISLRHFFYLVLLGIVFYSINSLNATYVKLMNRALISIQRRVNNEHKGYDRPFRCLEGLVKYLKRKGGIRVLGFFSITQDWKSYLYLLIPNIMLIVKKYISGG